jgi:2-polyprenyl-3-methyl-5-hydroxy-6-metoxy-1,4-benzoquinol methylase
MAAAHAMARRIEPEWLDALPALDARAIRARRDLRRVNALMGNARIVAPALASLPRGARLAEIGAGSGELMLALARSSPLREAHFHVTLVDRARCVEAATIAALRERGFEAQAACADVFDWLARAPACDAIVANLFLHHFEPAALARMLALVSSRTALFVACEPRRSRTALAGASLLGFVGCNDVTRHDAVVSVHAGFRGAEIAALWPREGGWTLEERACGPFSHRFVARRP